MFRHPSYIQNCHLRQLHCSSYSQQLPLKRPTLGTNNLLSKPPIRRHHSHENINYPTITHNRHMRLRYEKPSAGDLSMSTLIALISLVTTTSQHFSVQFRNEEKLLSKRIKNESTWRNLVLSYTMHYRHQTSQSPSIPERQSTTCLKISKWKHTQLMRTHSGMSLKSDKVLLSRLPLNDQCNEW